MKRYVLGFCFGPSLKTVVLIKKTRPAWQKGRLNGVGGHIENGETPHAAMAREFKEEASFENSLEWVQFGLLHGDGWEVHLFHAHNKVIPHPYNLSDEGEVSAHHLDRVLGKETSKGASPLPNLRYLIPMALNHHSGEDKARFFNILESNEQCSSTG
jgi:8-oxo-dGTP diphosphatase